MAYNFVQASNQRLQATPPIANAPMTFSAWIRRDEVATGNRTIFFLENSVQGNRMQVLVLSTNTLRCSVLYNELTASLTVTTTAPITSAQWTHVAASINANSTPFSMAVYLNGVKTTANASTSGTGGGFDVMSVGSYYGSNSFGGDIADVGLWNTALTDAEVSCLAKGIACNKIRPQSLQFYAPLVRNRIDIRGGRTITSAGAPTVSNHPRIYA